VKPGQLECLIIGRAKLGLECEESLKIVLEEDGTEIDNDYLPFVKPNTVLMMLQSEEEWSDGKSNHIY
jgi:hypothetical protein